MSLVVGLLLGLLLEEPEGSEEFDELEELEELPPELELGVDVPALLAEPAPAGLLAPTPEVALVGTLVSPRGSMSSVPAELGAAATLSDGGVEFAADEGDGASGAAADPVVVISVARAAEEGRPSALVVAAPAKTDGTVVGVGPVLADAMISAWTTISSRACIWATTVGSGFSGRFSCQTCMIRRARSGRPCATLRPTAVV